MHVHLVDGTYELFRAFYGAPSSSDVDGIEVGAVKGLLSSLTSLLLLPQVTHVAVAFDHVIESFRNELFAGYKTGEGIDPVLRGQFELAEAAVRALGVVVWPMVEFEADDALATGAARYAQSAEVEQVVLCTPDKDLAQCVRGSEIVCWDRLRDKVYDEQAVIEKFGVGPTSIADYLALVGDSADGIPGVAGWGAKSSAAVLAKYARLEHIPPDPHQWSVKIRGADKLAARLRAEFDAALLYRKLAQLRVDVPITEQVADLLYRGPVWAEFAGFAERFRQQGLLERLRAWAR